MARTREVSVRRRASPALSSHSPPAALDRPDRSIEVALAHLRRAGIEWSREPTDEDVDRELQRLRQLVAGRAVESLSELPAMTDPGWLATMDVLLGLLPPAMLAGNNLYDLVVLRMTSLSLEQGHCGASCHAYSHLNRVLGFRFGDYQTASRFGQLACELVKSRGLLRFEGRVYVSFGTFGLPWTSDLFTSRALLRRGFDGSTADGDVTFAIFGFKNLVTHLLVSGEPLPAVQRELEQGLALAGAARFAFAIDWFTAQLLLVRALRGPALDVASPDNAGYGDGAFERRVNEAPPLALCVCSHWIHKLQACVLARDQRAALEALEHATPLLRSVRALLEAADYHFYGALARAAACDGARGEERTQHKSALQEHQEQLRAWAGACPANFANRAALIDAEVARVEGRDLDAMRCYEEAVRSARERGFVQNEGLAHELAARFYAARGFNTIERAYLTDARACYARWGAEAKVRDLERLHPHLRAGTALPPARRATDAPIAPPELAAVVEMSRAISSEIHLERLVQILMVTALEHTSAARGVLVLVQEDGLHIEAEATTRSDSIEVCLRRARVAPSALPESVIGVALRTHESVILDDASLASPFTADAYLAQSRALSVLCMPLLRHTQSIGVLYLEDDRASHFTPTRVAALELLAPQAASSLESARTLRDAQRLLAYSSAAQAVSQTGSFGWRPATGEVFWSEETHQIFEHDRAAKPTIERIIERVHPDDVATVRDVIARGALNGPCLELEHRLLLPDGFVKFVQVVGHATRDGSGVVEYVGAIVDVTARKRAEQALRRSQRELAHVSRVKTIGELAASIAHEVNQPLAAVVASAGACTRWLDAQELDKARRSASRTLEDAHRACEIVGRIRALVQKTPPRKHRVDVNDTIRQAIALACAELQRNGVALELDLSAAVPAIVADRIELEQVIINLVVNGIEAMAPVVTRPKLMLIRSSVREGDGVLIAVQDSGVGIHAQDLEKIFDAFYTTKPHGTGMGLAISRAIVENHQGSLLATVNPEHGATFWLTLPAARRARRSRGSHRSN